MLFGVQSNGLSITLVPNIKAETQVPFVSTEALDLQTRASCLMDMSSWGLGSIFSTVTKAMANPILRTHSKASPSVPEY